jgi:hypothetical protein
MLTASQCETVAYHGDGAVYHPECARQRFSALTVEKADVGLDNSGGLRPLIRFELDEWQGQDAYALAEEYADRFEDDHPTLAATLGVASPRSGLDLSAATRNRYRLIDRLADRFADTSGPSCDECYELIS